MGDNWDDSDDDWDVDDDELDAKLGIKKPANDFDDEEDLALKEKRAADAAAQESLKKKGAALAEKKAAEKAQQEELELARKAMELEAEMESKMSVDERRALERQRVEEADNALTDDLFGAVESQSKKGATPANNDKIVLKDMKDHIKFAKKCADALKSGGKIHLSTIFLKELIQGSKDVLDDDAITDIIKTCNVIKNEKVQAAKRKVKGQATKTKKADKAAEAKARKIQEETFGDSNQYDAYDEMGEMYEDDFF